MTSTTDGPTHREALSPARAALLAKWKRGRSGQSRRPGVSRRSATGPAVLSFAQERLWLLDRLLGHGNSYNSIPLTAWLTGRVDVAILERSLAAVVARHEVMRTRFTVVDGSPRQVVERSAPVTVEVTDLRAHPAPTAEALRLARASRGHSFDLGELPLFRTRLFRVADEKHLLLHVMHHMISDGWSDDILIREVAAGYLALATGEPAALPALPVQYADYAEWQRGELSGERLASLLGYWRARLAGAPAAVDLPTDKPRPATQRFVATTHPVRIPAVTTRRLREIGKAEDATLFMTLVAAVDVLLARYSGQSDIVLGAPVAGRTGVETEALIGCFVNTLVLRTDLSGNPGFRELLRRVREAALGAYEHQDLPFERLVEDLQPDRDTSRNPLFQVMFALQNSPPADLAFGDFRLATVEMDNGVAKFDITIDLREFEGELIGRVQFDSDLFEPATCARMTAHFHRLLDGIAADPERALSELPILGRAEQTRMVTEWNATAVDHEISCVHRMIEGWAESLPDAVAVSAPDGQLTYGKLGEQAERLARILRSLGVGPETRVGLCVERSVQLCVGILGILKAGGAYVPLDPTHPVDRLTYFLQDAQASIVVTQTGLVSKLAAHEVHTVCLDALDESEQTPSGVEPTPDNIAYVIYTSGSTGRPKGVMVSHHAVTNMIRSTLREIGAGPGDSVLQFATLCFDVSVLEVFGALCSGARLVIPDSETVLRPDALTSLLAREQITIFDIPPAVLELLGENAAPALRIQFIGCEAFSGGLATRWQQPGRRLINGYGPTEATVMMTLQELDRPYTSMPPIGHPMPNHQVYVLDRWGAPVPVGVLGELYIGGAGLARGYLARPGLTADRFVPDSFGAEPGARLYRTGDLVRFRADGALEFAGRADQQVKIRGLRIEIGEIETVLGAHPDVQQAVVVVREGRPGGKHLVAYLQPRSGADWRTSELRRWLGQRLPAYLVPQVLTRIDRFPLLPSGKVDRSALPDPAGPEPDRPDDVAAPRTDLERVLGADVFAQVLGVDQIGVHDNFFQLGGNSLQLAALQSKISKELDVEVPLRVLFEAPSVGELAAYLGTLTPGMPDTARGIDPVTRPGHIPVSAQQERLWRQADQSGRWYNKPLAVRLLGLVDVELLRTAVSELVERHESLRTTFLRDGDQLLQVPHETLAPEFVVLDVAEEGHAGMRQRVDREVGHRFDLETGPLVRVQVLRLDDFDHVLVATVHPLLWDGWARGVFARELLVAGDVAAGGQSAAPLTLQYADYALWQRDWLAGDEPAKEVRFWQDRLAGAPPSPRLPGHTDGRGDSTGAWHPIPFPDPLADAVTELSRDAGVTAYTTLLAAFAVALRDLTGETDVVVGIPLANRVRVGTADLVGQFVNTLPVRVDVTASPTFRLLLSRLHGITTDVADHQEVPLDVLTEALDAERPLFGVTFDLLEVAADLPPVPGLEILPMEVATGRADFDLTLAIERRADGLHAAFSYATAVYPRDTVVRLGEHYLAVLHAVTADPDAGLAPPAEEVGGLAG